MNKVKPFVKWAGGKTRIMKQLLRLFPERFDVYLDPFIGGGSMLCGLKGRYSTFYMSDINEELIATYDVIEKHAEELMGELDSGMYVHKKKAYDEIRMWKVRDDPVRTAARFIYLNKNGYNGLYRLNSEGVFNVPFAKSQRGKLYDRENILEWRSLLRRGHIFRGDFRKVIEYVTDYEKEYSMFVYLDPPYYGTFDGYTGEGFTKMDHIDLYREFVKLTDKGIPAAVSNSDVAFIRELYDEFNLIQITSWNPIAQNGRGRKKKKELLITNYEK